MSNSKRFSSSVSHCKAVMFRCSVGWKWKKYQTQATTCYFHPDIKPWFPFPVSRNRLQNLQWLMGKVLQPVTIQAENFPLQQWVLTSLTWLVAPCRRSIRVGAAPEGVLQPTRQSSPSQMLLGDVRGEIGSLSCSSHWGFHPSNPPVKTCRLCLL